MKNKVLIMHTVIFMKFMGMKPFTCCIAVRPVRAGRLEETQGQNFGLLHVWLQTIKNNFHLITQIYDMHVQITTIV